MLLLSVVVAGPLVLTAGGAQAAAVDRTTLVSATNSGGFGNGPADRPHVSADGRFVAFDSAAALVPGDTNRGRDLFVRDLRTGTTELVSVARDGGPADGYSTLATISDDGRYVAFQSLATNLVPGDTNNSGDIFLRDRQAGTTTLVSVNRFGGPAYGQSTRPTISGDGRLVAFNSSAQNMLPTTEPDTNKVQDIFVRDMVTGEMERVSVGLNGAQANGDSVRPEMRGNGRFVAFESSASNLVAGDGNGKRDVFLFDRQTRVTERASVAADGSSSTGEASRPHLTPDGRYVAFQTLAGDIVAGDTNVKRDVFVRDMTAGTTTLVSVSSDEVRGRADSTRAVLSYDGRYVAFNSASANLTPQDTNSREDVLLRDLVAGTTRRLSVSATGAASNGTSYRPEISADGSTVVYLSAATNLVPGDTNGADDVFAVPTAAAAADTVAPTVTLTQPAGSSTVTTRQVTASGVARDDTTVAKVQVALKDRDTGQYLRSDGTWGAGFQRLTATLGASGTGGTEWSFTTALPDGRYYLQAVAKDAAGNLSGKPEVVFVVSAG